MKSRLRKYCIWKGWKKDEFRNRLFATGTKEKKLEHTVGLILELENEDSSFATSVWHY
jgi:hypothetical protein